MTDLQKMAPAVRWTRQDQLHVTVKFFGNVEESLLQDGLAEAIRAAVADERPCAIECTGLGVFPNWKYPRIIWAGFSGDTEPLLTLHERVADALKGFPLREDDRMFRLHLTIGRAKSLSAKSPLVKTVESLGPIQFGAVPIDHLTLYKSQLTSTGSIYTPITTFPFGQGGRVHAK